MIHHPITKIAARNFKRIREDEELPEDVPLRVSVKGGGCAGFNYKWEFVNSEVEDVNSDEIIKLDKGLLYIHPTAIMYVLGTIIDFTKDVAGSYLKINNPNATSQCGCGESFAYG